MPLFEITSITPLNTTFTIAFGLASGETQEDFCWLLQQLKELIQHSGAQQPLVFLTDHDNQLCAAAAAIFPSTKLLLCTWHIIKNVKAQLKSKWCSIEQAAPNKDTLTANKEAQEDFILDFRQLVYNIPSPDEWEPAWQGFKRKYSSQPGRYHITNIVSIIYSIIAAN